VYSIRFNSAYQKALEKSADQTLNSKVKALLEAGLEALKVSPYESEPANYLLDL